MKSILNRRLPPLALVARWLGYALLLSAITGTALADGSSVITDLRRVITSNPPAPRDTLLSLIQLSQVVLSKIQPDSPNNSFVDADLLKQLSVLSSTNDDTLRIQATLLIVKSVNIGNVCGIIDTLFEDDVNPNARINLWNIVNGIASGLPSDVSNWAIQAAAETATLTNEGAYDLRFNIHLSSLPQLRLTNESQFRSCLGLDNIAATYLQIPAVNNGFKLYLHSSQPQETTDAVKKALTEAGFSVFSVDRHVDDVGGNGVDYRIPDSSGVALEKAAAIASIVRKQISGTIAPRPQSIVSAGVFGVWF